MKSFSREEDVAASAKAAESKQSYFLKIPDAKTPWRLVNLDYQDGFVHWYEAGGMRRRIVCGGGIEGKGFAPDDCPICAHVLALYAEAKELKEAGQDNKSERVRKLGNMLRAKFEAQTIAIRGQRVLVKTQQGKRWVADWDMESEDSEVQVGIISLSRTSWEGLRSMIKSEEFPFIKSGDDLANRVLWTTKEKSKGGDSRFKEVVWSADEKPSDAPEVEIPEDMLIEDNFEINQEELEKVYQLLTGQSSEEVEEGEEVAVEEDSTAEPDNSYLEDLPEEGAQEEEGGEEGTAEEETSEEAFEDDIPGEAPVQKKLAAGKKPPIHALPRKAVGKVGGQPVARPASPGKARYPVGRPAPMGRPTARTARPLPRPAAAPQKAPPKKTGRTRM